MAEDKRMDPQSGEPVESDGVYANEWGRLEAFRRGDIFPADPMLGTTEWKQVEVRYDEEMREGNVRNDKQDSPRGHVDRGDK
ncbi:hypothetical protein ACFQWB_10395 [Paenibacillus thermoaerophilus]|uniref:Transposase n=1 Tax=Paenibacillus thermoaerophilus TaxID=1215385 RepID=A0ABW2V6D4_9BACL|nr:hypothetical protein [Paenibacillus thermoaerophilus]TMV18815.1 hypothetical protein FE781_02495 [Paenibacillus thermoaerophilus]